MCRVSKDYYAALLGGIMLSIGVQLSVADFAIVLKRYCIFLK
jgi:BASS family bile acid:Na+ symporter